MLGNSGATRLKAALALSILCGFVTASPATAQIGGERYAAIVTDARTGTVLIAHSPDEHRYPASLTKMMTVYMAFEALRDGRISLSSPIRVSAEAASMPPSRLGLAAGMTITVEEAILALVTKSANDAAAALGEYLGGSEERFAQMMTMKARALGMTRTTFRNASGLPNLDQVSTARDMALLGRRLVHDFPDRYAYFSTPHFVFRGRTHWNHNRLLQEYDGTDGIKTGYVNDSGFNLVASAQRQGVRLIASVFGGRTGRERDRHMMALLDQGFGTMGIDTPRREAPVHMARRAAPGLLATANAAPMRQVRLVSRAQARVASTARPAPAPAARAAARSRPAPALAPPPARTTLLRMTATTRQVSPARIEQGDTSRGTVARTATRVSRSAAKPAKPVAVARPGPAKPARKRGG